MTCPKCGYEQVEAPACARCGVVVSKLRAAGTAPSRPARRDPPAPSAGPSSRIGLVVLGVAAAAIVALVVFERPARRSATTPSDVVRPEPGAPADAEASPEPLASLAPIELPSPDAAPPTSASEADQATAQRLTAGVNARTTSDADVREAESLLARYPDVPVLKGLLVAVLLTRVAQQHDGRRFAESLPLLDRVLELDDTSLPARRGRLHVFLETGQWTAAEGAARDLMGRVGSDADAVYALGFALLRQDRNREAADVLAPHEGTDERIASLLDRVRRGLQSERGMVERNLSHFHVRYDGDAHDDVGREILRALERHYATLVRTFDHEPAQAIPVILFSREAYQEASGAPAWSGGVYDGLDGRIRIPIGGLGTSLSDDVDGTLVHELTHAFVWDMSRGRAPREVHEGIAQYMEGRRSERELPEDALTALADGRMGGVGGYYAAALSFVEFLMAQRGQGGMNDVLRTMGAGATVDEAFDRVYGRTLGGMHRAWAERLRQQHGSS